MPGGEPRAALAAAQAALLAALVGAGEIPPGFDADRIRVQSRALLEKRARAARAHHPWLGLALGDTYLQAFAAFARTCPQLAGSHAHDDAAAFERHLAAGGLLPPAP
ncbi:hypothetical protein GA0115240_140658, partial [Streptomyces sp. DvalAA-14]